MRSSLERSLALRMGCAIVLLLLAMIGFVAAIWGVFLGILLLFRVSVSSATTLALVPTAAALLWIAVLEWRAPTIEETVAAIPTPVTAEKRPELHAAVTRVASMLDVPTPTVAVSETSAPEALVVGIRPTNARLILSEVTLEALDDAELEAVIAHELAHVKNRDAAVMTLLLKPMVLTIGLAVRMPERVERVLAVSVPLVAVSLAGTLVVRTIVSVCSRTRELAADDVAAEVLGSSAPLASALQTLDRHIRDTPSEDLRTARSASSLSILPLEPSDAKPLTYWEEAGVKPFLWSVRKRLSRLFRTHPPTEGRLERLATDERKRTRNRSATQATRRSR